MAKTDCSWCHITSLRPQCILSPEPSCFTARQDIQATLKSNLLFALGSVTAFGLQKGNLNSCKARIELKAVKQNGEVLVVDRQTPVAVDIAEQTAAKTALQRAAVELAGRIIPQLTK